MRSLFAIGDQTKFYGQRDCCLNEALNDSDRSIRVAPRLSMKWMAKDRVVQMDGKPKEDVTISNK